MEEPSTRSTSGAAVVSPTRSRKKNEGIYAVVNFDATSEATNELDRQLKLNEQIMRTKVLRAEEAIAQVAAEAKRSEGRPRRKAAAPRKVESAEKAAK